MSSFHLRQYFDGQVRLHQDYGGQDDTRGRQKADERRTFNAQHPTSNEKKGKNRGNRKKAAIRRRTHSLRIGKNLFARLIFFHHLFIKGYKLSFILLYNLDYNSIHSTHRCSCGNIGSMFSRFIIQYHKGDRIDIQ